MYILYRMKGISLQSRFIYPSNPTIFNIPRTFLYVTPPLSLPPIITFHPSYKHFPNETSRTVIHKVSVEHDGPFRAQFKQHRKHRANPQKKKARREKRTTPYGPGASNRFSLLFKNKIQSRRFYSVRRRSSGLLRREKHARSRVIS